MQAEPLRDDPEKQCPEMEMCDKAVVDARLSISGSTSQSQAESGTGSSPQSSSDSESYDKTISGEEPHAFTSPFWQEPLEKDKFFRAPYSRFQFRLLAEQVERVAEYLRSRGFEAKRHELIHRIYTDVLPAAEEFETLRRELEPQRQELERAIRETEEALRETEKQVYAKLAEARLPIPKPTLNGKRVKKAPAPPEVSPALVERAIEGALANATDICGEQGIILPVEQRDKGLRNLDSAISWVLELLAPLTAGTLLGINIAVITGFLSLENLFNQANLLLIGFAVLIGFVVERMGGSVYQITARSIAQASEKREVGNEVQSFPYVKRTFLWCFLVPLAFMLGVAIVTVDSIGLQMLHEELIQEAKKYGERVSKPHHPALYFVIGVIAGLPYLIYKAVRGWRDAEILQREARIEYLRWQHAKRIRSEPAVQKAFALAQEAVGLREKLQRLQQQRAFICQRLDSARTQAIGCHEQFRNYFQQLLQEIDGVYPVRGGAESPESGTSSTWLGRLLGRLFRRR